MQHIDKLIEISKRKSNFDENNSWYQGSSTYLVEIKKEVDEVIEEIPKDRLCYLEDELADVLWDYLNAVLSLEKEKGINLDSIIERACRKYDERVTAIESRISWDEVKEKQKSELAREQSLQHT
ncbi:nucleotide pyrophosphohydrolase [Vibrio metschnikovii]|nr:nucleotide pyrophosphohydrolase [Vibrio metschnikovii]